MPQPALQPHPRGASFKNRPAKGRLPIFDDLNTLCGSRIGRPFRNSIRFLARSLQQRSIRNENVDRPHEARGWLFDPPDVPDHLRGRDGGSLCRRRFHRGLHRARTACERNTTESDRCHAPHPHSHPLAPIDDAAHIISASVPPSPTSPNALATSPEITARLILPGSPDSLPAAAPEQCPRTQSW